MKRVYDEHWIASILRDYSERKINLGDALRALEVEFKYTGFLDSVGEAVYEGDTIRTDDGKETKVEWKEKDYGYGSLWWMVRYAEKAKVGIKKVKGDSNVGTYQRNKTRN